MNKADVLELLRAHREEIGRRFGVRYLALFGSVARDEAREDSDVDILVTFEVEETFDSYMDLKFYLEDLLGRRVDLVTTGGLREAVRPYVERELIRVA